MLNTTNERVEHPFRIRRTRASLRVELCREPRIRLVADTLVRAVVHVHEQRFPVGRQRLVIDGIAVILRSDEALRATNTLHRLVVRAVTVFQLVGLGTCGTRQQLVAQADAHAGTYSLTPGPSPNGEGSGYFFRFSIQECTNVLYRFVALLWVARTVGQEQTVELQLVEVVVPRHTNHLNASLNQTTNDIRLHATVNEHDAFE